MTGYSDKEIEDELEDLTGWSYDGDRIRKKYEFDLYVDGIEFVADVAQFAEKMNHHPDLHVGFREVEVTIKSHDVDAITDRDFSLARRIEDELM